MSIRPFVVNHTLLFFVFFSCLVNADVQGSDNVNDDDNPNIATSVCSRDSHFADFNFWLGNWDVYDSKTRQLAGRNKIESIESDCGIQERWISQNGGTGMSLNYYNPISKKWRQIWIAAPGYSIDIEGGLVKGSMVLIGTITDYSESTTKPFRGKWTPHSDGTVRQFFELYNDQEKTWAPWFDGLYQRSGN